MPQATKLALLFTLKYNHQRAMYSYFSCDKLVNFSLQNWQIKLLMCQSFVLTRNNLRSTKQNHLLKNSVLFSPHSWPLTYFMKKKKKDFAHLWAIKVYHISSNLCSPTPLLPLCSWQGSKIKELPALSPPPQFPKKVPINHQICEAYIYIYIYIFIRCSKMKQSPKVLTCKHHL